MARKGHRKILGIIMAPHQSKVSWEWYQQTVQKGINVLGDSEKPAIDYLDPWYTHEGYVGAIAEIIKTACGDKLESCRACFYSACNSTIGRQTPHPTRNSLQKQVKQSLKRSEKLEFGLAYQSEVENSPIPWTQPDINDWLKARKKEGVNTVVASPIGFLCDHVEVLMT